jgi:anti-sigma factor (TIGR02949 family)
MSDEKLDCEAAMRRLWEYLDRELTGDTREAVRVHLHECASCYGHYEFERAFLAALGDAERERRAPESLHGRVLHALRSEGFVPRYGES